jgi:ABC-2 type transport system permease protein
MNGAGINGAGLGAGAGGVGEAGQIPLGGGALGPVARAQYGALARLRWQMLSNGLRFRKGALELGVRTLGFLVYGFTGLVLGGGVGFATYVLTANREWRFVPLVFWATFVLWQMIPVMMASFQEQFDLGSLLRFPVSFQSFFLLYAVFGLADISSILGGLCCLGIWVGVTVALPGMFVWTTVTVALFAVFNILLVRAIFAWIDRWLAQRKTREILGAVFMVLILSAQMLNPALRNGFPSFHPPSHKDAVQNAQHYREMQARYVPLLDAANAVQKWLPPGLAAVALRQAAGQVGGQTGGVAPGAAAGSFGLIGLYALVAGAVLGTRLRAEYRGENLGQAPKRTKAAPTRAKVKAGAPANAVAKVERGNGWLSAWAGPIGAVMEKDLRMLMRSIPQLYMLGAPLLMVFIFGRMFRSSGGGIGHSFTLALPVCMAYSMLGFTQLFANNLGTEGAGIQLLFLSPTPFRTVLLAKNLFHAMLFGLDALVAGILVSLRLGLPDSAVLVGTIGWLLFALPANLAIGNIFSITMPFKVNPGRLTRQRGSQANALLSLLTQLAVMAVGALVFGLCWYLDRLWLAAPVFLVLAGASVFAWLRVLGNAEGMANRRKDALILTLVKTE